MVTQQELKGFARGLNEVVPIQDRGTHPSLTTGQSVKVALEGVTPPDGAAVRPSQAPEVRKPSSARETASDLER
jgi:hypothetical protein